jgi:hypothetical protein
MKGPKKSIPRALRFVLLELSLEARPTAGVLDLPVKWETLRAVHDLLGGNRREVREALKIFSLPDESGQKVITIDRDFVTHRLTINKWREWAGPKSSTDRVREHRKNKGLGEPVTFHGETDVTPTGQDRRGQDKIPPNPPGGRAGGFSKSDPTTPEAQRAESSGESPFDAALRIYSAFFLKRHHRPFMLTSSVGKQSDEAALRRIGQLAESKGDREVWLHHWMRAYLRDDEAELVDNAHPPRWLEKRLNKYGIPKKPRPPEAVRASEPPSAPVRRPPSEPVHLNGKLNGTPPVRNVSTREELEAKAKADKQRLAALEAGGKGGGA